MKTKHNETISLTDVWKWKEKVYENIKNIEDKAGYFEKNTKEIIHRLRLEKISLTKKAVSFSNNAL